MLLRELFLNPRKSITEGGNLEIGGHQAQHLDLKVHQRGFIVPILNTLLHAINKEFHKQYKQPLWSAKTLSSQQFLSGSSLHFFNTGNIPDDQFVKVKPTVGDIDTMVDINNRESLEAFLQSVQGKKVGPATFHGYKLGNEQFSSMWELHNPPVKVQIDFEFVKYEQEEPTQWAKFSHSSSWDDLQAGVKGVFHKFIIQSLAGLSNRDFMERKLVGRGKARAEQDVPANDNMVSFAVSSKEGGGLRQKYEPVLDDAGQPLVKDGLPVMRARPATGYEQDVGSIFTTLAGHRIDPAKAKHLEPKFWSFVGILDIMNAILPQEEKEKVANGFIEKLFAKGAQGLYKGNPDKDAAEKNAAVNKLYQVLKLKPPQNLNQMRSDYYNAYKGAQNFSESLFEAEEQPAVKAQLRKGMPHLRDLKAADFLDLLDEIHDGNGKFKLENIPLNVKVDGFGGRFGKNKDGKPFMGTSRTEPRYQASFVKYHQEKGTTDPEVLGRAQMFDDLFAEMMNAVKLVDSKLGADFLVNKQVTCEVLYLPFATETPEGKLKFVGIHYDKLPKGVKLALVPFHVVHADSAEPVENDRQFIEQLLKVGQQGSVMFVNNRLVQKQGLDVTEIINPLDNLEELKRIVSDTAGKRDRASLALRKQVEEKLMPIKLNFENAVINDPNIIGKDMLGKDYEGIVINSRLGPIKITSQEQKKVIADKQAAKKAAWQEQPRENQSKTAVVAVGSAIGHVGHQQLFNYAVKKAHEVGGDPYMFIGPAEGKDDPIPPNVKVQTWHKLYPQYANNISTMAHEGGTLLQKIKHELINPLPGKAPRYDNIIITVGTDRADLATNWSKALMKAVNKFQGYEHVKVTPYVTGRGEEEGGTGVSGTQLRNVLKDVNKTPEQQFAVWNHAYNSGNSGAQRLHPDWIHHLMDIARKGMGIAAPHTSPSGVRTNMPKNDDDYAINYGPQGLAKPQQPVNIKEANRLIRAMRAKEFVTETTGKHHPHHVAATQGVGTNMDAEKINPGLHYLRTSMAVAMADGSNKHLELDHESFQGPAWSEQPYTEVEHNMLKQARKAVPTAHKQLIPFKKSAEPDDTHKVSSVATKTKNRYGV